MPIIDMLFFSFVPKPSNGGIMMRVLLISSGLLGSLDVSALKALAITHLRDVPVMVVASAPEALEHLHLGDVPVLVVRQLSEPEEKRELRLGFELPILPPPDLSFLTLETTGVNRKVENPAPQSRGPPRSAFAKEAGRTKPSPQHTEPARVS